MEAGAVAEFNGRYYAIVGQGSRTMKTMIAANPAGPYTVAPTNYALLENSGEHKHTYFARFLRTPDDILVNHHAVTRFQLDTGRDICYWAPLKRAFVDDNGTLWFGYWQGNEALKKNPVSTQFAAPGRAVQMAEESVDTAGGVVIEGSVTLPAAGQPESDWPGLYVEYAPGLGSYIQVGPAGVTHFGLMAESETNPSAKTSWPAPGPSATPSLSAPSSRNRSSNSTSTTSSSSPTASRPKPPAALESSIPQAPF